MSEYIGFEYQLHNTYVKGPDDFMRHVLWNLKLGEICHCDVSARSVYPHDEHDEWFNMKQVSVTINGKFYRACLLCKAPLYLRR